MRANAAGACVATRSTILASSASLDAAKNREKTFKFLGEFFGLEHADQIKAVLRELEAEEQIVSDIEEATLQETIDDTIEIDSEIAST